MRLQREIYLKYRIHYFIRKLLIKLIDELRLNDAIIQDFMTYTEYNTKIDVFCFLVKKFCTIFECIIIYKTSNVNVN